MIPYLHFLYIQLGPLKLYTWGFFVALGFLLSLAILIKQNPKDKNIFIDLALYIIIGAIIGSRLLYVAVYAPDTIEALKNIFKIWEGGMSSFGGILGGAGAAIAFLKRKKLDINKYVQKLAFILPLGMAIGRIGCFLINDHPGIKTIATPFSVAYPDGSRFDLGFLLMLFNALIFIYFLILRKTYPQAKALYLESFLLIYGIGRFLLDFLRIGEPSIAGLIPSQYGSILLVAIGTYLIIKKRKS